MKARIGYLVPEFPGQTHTWIWRDLRALEELDIKADLVSTRPPKQVVHAWSAQAQAMTHYLTPFSARDAWIALVTLTRAGPRALARCLAVPFRAKDLSAAQRLRLVALIVVAARLAAMADERGWKLLNVLSAGDAAHIAAFAHRLSGIDFGVTLLAPLEGYGGHQKEKWEGSSFAMVVNEQLLAEVRDKLGDTAPAQIAIAPMGVDVDQCKRTVPYRPWQPGQSCRLYTCGRLNPVKGHKYLFEAFVLLAAKGYPVSLQVAGAEEGKPGYREGLVQQLKQLGIEKNVEFLGGVSEERHRQALQEAHVFVLPSLHEGVSVAAMEAMAMQTPTIATDVGGMRELITPEIDALMVPAQDPQALADAIMRILDDPDLALRLSAQSRKKVEATFHHRRCAEAIARYLGVLDDGANNKAVDTHQTLAIAT